MKGGTGAMRLMQYAGAEVAGGLTRHLETLVQGLADAGHEVRVVLSPAPTIDQVAASCVAAGAAVTRLTVRGKTDLGGLVRFGKLVGRERPDLLHLHLSSPIEAMPAMMAARWSGAGRIVITEHAPTWYPLEKAYSRAARKAVHRSIDAVIALSCADASFLQDRFGVPADRIRVIPNGVPVPRTSLSPEEARSRLGLAARSAPIIGYAGALEPKKGVLDLVDAAALLPSDDLRDLTLVMAGEGTCKGELRRRAERLGIALTLCGRVRDIGAFLSALDLFALPSHQEAMPLALLEAMAVGLPVVATRVGGIPEAIEDGVTGLLVEPRNPTDLAAALSRLIRDGALRRSVADAARRASREQFDAGLMLRRIQDLYRGILSEAAGATA